MPKRIKLFHQVWEYEFVPASKIEEEWGQANKDGEYYNGSCHPGKSKIYIVDSLPFSKAIHTIIHETYHALADMTGISDRKLTEEESADFTAFIFPEIQKALRDLQDWIDENY